MVAYTTPGNWFWASGNTHPPFDQLAHMILSGFHNFQCIPKNSLSGVFLEQLSSVFLDQVSSVFLEQVSRVFLEQVSSVFLEQVSSVFLEQVSRFSSNKCPVSCVLLLLILMIFHLSVFLKTYFVFDSSKEKNVFLVYMIL